jgi:hypothetical protein
VTLDFLNNRVDFQNENRDVMFKIFRSGLGCYTNPLSNSSNEGWGEMAVRKFNNQGDMLYQMGFWGTGFTKSYNTCQG